MWPVTVVPAPSLEVMVREPPTGVEAVGDALQAAAHRGGRGVEADPVVDHLEAQPVDVATQPHLGRRRVGVLRDVLQPFQHREVGGRLDVRFISAHAGGRT